MQELSNKCGAVDMPRLFKFYRRECRLKEYIKEQLIDVRSLAPVPPVGSAPIPAVSGLTGPAAVLAGLI